jgi:Tol biopolymer transport system component
LATTKRPFYIAAILAGSFSFAAPALADNHPERGWLVKESAHFSLHYYAGIEQTSDRLLRAAEEAYPKLQADFGVASMGAKIPIIINQDAFFNGEAEPIKDRITLDPLLASTSVIGTQRFVAHELAHVMTFASVDTGNKMGMLQNVGGLPTWFLEGIAQFEAEYWYPSNDRMLRLHTLEGSLLTETERENFRMLGVHAGAAGYNEGYALCRYIFDTYGHDKVKVLMANLKDGKHTFEQAIEITFGQNLPAITAAWHQALKDGYKQQIAGLQDVVPGATKLIPTYKGEVNVQPRLSPDGKKLAYLTSRYQDSFLYLRGNVMGMLSLYVADADGRNPQMIPVGKGTVANYAWSPDGSKLLYTRVVGDAQGNPCWDLFTYDMKAKKVERLTTNENTNTMAWRPGTNQVLFVALKDGKATIKTVDVASKKTKVVLVAEGETQFIQPAWSPDGLRVAFASHQPGEASHLVTLEPDTGRLAQITPGAPRQSDKEPTWTPDGKHLVFTSDRTGMTNLYQVDLDGKGLRKLTNTYRGAEMASVSPDGKSLFYTSYRAKGAEIFRVPLGSGTPVDVAAPAPAAKPPKPMGLSLNQILGGPTGGPSADVHAANPAAAALTQPSLLDAPGAAGKGGALDKAVADSLTGDIKPYKPTMTNDLLMPQMTSDEKGQQLGVAGQYSDILDKHELGFDVRYGIMSSRFSYLFQYTNRMFNTSWQLSLYDQPQIALSPDVGSLSTNVVDSLYFQRQRGVALGTITPLGSGRSLFAGANMSDLSTLSDPKTGNFGQLRQGQLNTLRLGLREQNVRSTVDMDINPSDGYVLNADWQMSDHNFGSNYDFSQFLLQGERYFQIIPDLRHNLTWRWNLGLINGDAPQPFLLGGANASNPIFALRGYAVGAMNGNRLASTGLEYTLPVFEHIDKMFGPLYLDRLYVSAFTDVGSAWNNGNANNPFASAGAEIRLKTSIMGRQVLTLRFGLAQKLGTSEAPGFYLTF